MPEIPIPTKVLRDAESWLSKNGKPVELPDVGKAVKGWKVGGQFVELREEEELIYKAESGESRFGSYSVLMYERAQGLGELLRIINGLDRVSRLPQLQ